MFQARVGVLPPISRYREARWKTRRSRVFLTSFQIRFWGLNLRNTEIPLPRNGGKWLPFSFYSRIIQKIFNSIPLKIILNTERRHKRVSSSYISGFVWRLHVSKWGTLWSVTELDSVELHKCVLEPKAYGNTFKMSF